MFRLLPVICAVFFAMALPISQAQANENARLFGKRPDILSIALSPSGQKIVWISPSKGKGTQVFATDIDVNQPKMFIEFDGQPNSVDWCEFTSEKNVICRILVQRKVDGDQSTASRLISVDIDGKNLHGLGEKCPRCTSGGWILNWLKGQPNKVLYVNGIGIRVYDTMTGELDKKSLARHERNADFYIDNSKGVVRIMGVNRSRGATAYADNSMRYYYRDDTKDNWKPLSAYDSSNDEGFVPLILDEPNNRVLGLEKVDGRNALSAIKLESELAKELVFQHPTVDVSGIISLGRDGRPIGARFADERSQIHYLDEDLAKTAKGLSKAIPGLPNIRFIDVSEDESKLLLFAGSDRDPGRYYLYDRKGKTLRELLLLRPALENFPTAKVESISYNAADGTAVPGYLTIPSVGEKKNLPLVVMPHGGPESRDVWGFDWWAQFFASNGYAVLQPNFRGSAGYGEDWFVENGFKSWRTAIGDINDAARWAISKGIADPKRTAIAGWSYGGYAALQSAVTEPGLFSAVIAVAPVTDLAELKQDSRRFTSYVNTKEFIGKGPHIASGSPARHAERIAVPVLLFHGDADWNVNVGHSKRMAKALSNAGKPHELVIYEKLYHGLWDDDARTDMLTKSNAFLKKHLGD